MQDAAPRKVGGSVRHQRERSARRTRAAGLARAAGWSKSTSLNWPPAMKALVTGDVGVVDQQLQETGGRPSVKVSLPAIGSAATMRLSVLDSSGSEAVEENLTGRRTRGQRGESARRDGNRRRAGDDAGDVARAAAAISGDGAVRSGPGVGAGNEGCGLGRRQARRARVRRRRPRLQPCGKGGSNEATPVAGKGPRRSTASTIRVARCPGTRPFHSICRLGVSGPLREAGNTSPAYFI